MALKKHEVEMGHARALLSLDSPTLQLKLFRDVLKNQYSVRKVEKMVQMLKSGEDVQTAKKRIVAQTQVPDEVGQLKDKLTEKLQTKVQVTYGAGGKGKISIPFASDEELKRLLSLIH